MKVLCYYNLHFLPIEAVKDHEAVAEVSARVVTTVSDILKSLQIQDKFDPKIIDILINFLKNVLDEIQVIAYIAKNIERKDITDVVEKLEMLLKEPDVGLEHHIKQLLKILPLNLPKYVLSSVITAIVMSKLDEVLLVVKIFGEHGVSKELLVPLVEKVLHVDKTVAVFIVEHVKVQRGPGLFPLVVQRILQTLPRASGLGTEIDVNFGLGGSGDDDKISGQN